MKAIQRVHSFETMLRKTIEGTQKSFDYIMFEKIISKQSMFVFDRTTNLQFRKMLIEIYGSLATIQCHAGGINALYREFTS